MAAAARRYARRMRHSFLRLSPSGFTPKARRKGPKTGTTRCHYRGCGLASGREAAIRLTAGGGPSHPAASGVTQPQQPAGQQRGSSPRGEHGEAGPRPDGEAAGLLLAYVALLPETRGRNARPRRRRGGSRRVLQPDLFWFQLNRSTVGAWVPKRPLGG